ncbi:MAG: sugar phosphate isomerase/epimerase [Nitrospirae bacterium]|nr:sugar phosphate isomerase/epimerase [Nitrospirota bacterium]
MKRIRIGNQTAFSAPPTLPFEYAAANGFDAFEWFPDRDESGAGWDVQDMDPGTRRYIRETAETHDIALSVHASLKASPMIPEAHGQLVEEFVFARDIGAKLFNIHLYTDEGIEAYVKAITPVVMLSAKMGMRLSIENTPLTSPDDFNRLFRLLLEVGGAKVAHVGMCLDVGHANLCASTRNDYLGFTGRIEPFVPVVHIHMHENYGDSDSHLTVFTGPSREDPSGIESFISGIKARGFSGSLILEQWPQPPALLDQARDRLRRMLGPGNE